MSPEIPTPEPADSKPPATPSQGENLTNSMGSLDSKPSASEESFLLDDVWESAELDSNPQPTVTEEVPVEKPAAPISVNRSPRDSASSRVTSSSPVATKQATRWQKFQRYWQAEIQPALKEQTIKTLKAIIRSLNALVTWLEAKPVSPSDFPQSATPPRKRGVWGSILDMTRSLLPRSLRRLSDPLLSGAIGGVLLLTLWISSSLMFSKPPTQVATAPSAKSAPGKSTDTAKKSSKDELSQVKPDTDAIADQPLPKQTLLPAPPQKATDAIRETIPRGIVDSPSPAPTVTPTPSPSPIPKPAPPLKLTPEQTLIARIQDQVADVSNQYVNGLIQSVQANFRSSLLTVKIGDGWYTLEQSQQNKLSNEMLKRAQQLDFLKLEMTDPEGNLLARSPVVGSEMVILKRTTSLPQIT
jgi:hypothetical protein